MLLTGKKEDCLTADYQSHTCFSGPWICNDFHSIEMLLREQKHNFELLL